MTGGDGLGKGLLQQHLREQGLGMDIGPLAEQDEANEGEECSKDGPSHEQTSTRMSLSFRGVRSTNPESRGVWPMTVDEQLWIPRCAIAHLRFDASRRPGMSVFVLENRARGLGGRKAARALKEEGGAPPPSPRRQLANFRRRLNI